METLDYIKLAVSKDKTRYNICSIYRDKNHFVATDGHRLHYANGLPDADPHFIDGRDAQYPDWKQVLPNSTKEVLSIKHNDYINALKPFLEFIPKIGRYKREAVKVEGKNGVVEFNYTDKDRGLNLSCKIIGGSDFDSTGYGAKYLLDALKPLEKMKNETATFILDDINAPLRIEYRAFNGKAVIMPCRFE